MPAPPQKTRVRGIGGARVRAVFISCACCAFFSHPPPPHTHKTRHTHAPPPVFLKSPSPDTRTQTHSFAGHSLYSGSLPPGSCSLEGGALPFCTRDAHAVCVCVCVRAPRFSPFVFATAVALSLPRDPAGGVAASCSVICVARAPLSFSPGGAPLCRRLSGAGGGPRQKAAFFAGPSPPSSSSPHKKQQPHALFDPPETLRFLSSSEDLETHRPSSSSSLTRTHTHTRTHAPPKVASRRTAPSFITRPHPRTCVRKQRQTRPPHV